MANDYVRRRQCLLPELLTQIVLQGETVLIHIKHKKQMTLSVILLDQAQTVLIESGEK